MFLNDNPIIIKIFNDFYTVLTPSLEKI